jgi:hypothetical protein
MTNMYEYVVLRLSSNSVRAEVVNVGSVLFIPNGGFDVRMSASLNKFRLLDADWTTAKVSALRTRIEDALAQFESVADRVNALSVMGLCKRGEPGFFFANNSAEVEREMRLVESHFIATPNLRKQRGQRSRLHGELSAKFKSMDLLGRSIDDLAHHRIVPHVPVPGHPDLKSDFVYKNGVYRITQTLDYRVAVRGAHQKISEACTKTMAAQLATHAWGETTKKFAIVNIPAEVADVADGHIDLLIANGFEIFHDTANDLANYHNAVFSH